MIQAQCGDREALELLLRSAQPALHRYVSRIVGATDADDVVQNVLVTLARKLTWLAEPQPVSRVDVSNCQPEGVRPRSKGAAAR